MSNSQRTKGNTKPSNSDRAARLLQSKQFLSFSQASQTLSSVYTANNITTVANDDDLSSFKYELSSDFQVIFKHMTKKDLNTKLKALQDLIALCSTKSEDELLKISSYWCRIYRKLANVIDWRVRQEVHNAHNEFLSKLLSNREVFISTIVNVNNGNTTEQFESDATGTTGAEASFQSLVTMPSIMWCNIFDSYSQAAESARKAFQQLYSTQSEQIGFLLDYCDTILNYCVYCIFDKVPIKLFYTNELPTDSVKVFEEHILVTSFRGLSMLINELICFWLQSTEKDEQTQSRALQCLKKIFVRLNAEFVTAKFGRFNTKKPANNEAVSSASQDVLDSNQERVDNIFLSKKEKKKLRKEANEKMVANKGQANKTERGSCKFWTYLRSDSTIIRLAAFHALNSLTRLNTFQENHFQEENVSLDDLHSKDHLWYKLYKAPLFEQIFTSFVDPVAEIRGLAWLLGAHVISHETLYKPWTVVQQDKWLQDTLIPFVANGMKCVGNVIDFGLFRLGLDIHQPLYSEFFSKRSSHISALQLVNDNYNQLDVLVNVKLVMMLLDAFNKSHINELNLKIFQSFLYALENAVMHAVLQKDVDMLVEIYFNVIFYIISECLQLPIRIKLDSTNQCNITEELKLDSLFSDILLGHLYNLMMVSLESVKSEHLCNSQLYAAFHLVVYYVTERYQKLRTEVPEWACRNLLQIYTMFKFNVNKFYTQLFNLVLTDLKCRLTMNEFKTKFALSRVLRLVNDSVLIQPDGYFSSYYYVTRNNANIDKSALKILKTSILSSGHTKQVNFIEEDTQKSLFTSPPASTGGSWWKKDCRQSIFGFSLSNQQYNDDGYFKNTSISMLVEYSSLNELVVLIAAQLFKLVDQQMNNRSDPSNTLLNNDELLLVVQHIQYLLRSFKCPQLAKLQNAPELTEADDLFVSILDSYLLKWIDCLYDCCESHEPTSEEIRFNVLIARKIFDVLLVVLCANEDKPPSTNVLQNIFHRTSPFSYNVLLYHLATLPVPYQYNSIALLQTQLSDSITSQTESQLITQINRLFDKVHARQLDCEIMANLWMLLLKPSQLGYHLGSPSIRAGAISKTLTLLRRRLEEFVMDKEQSSAKYTFLFDFPFLCLEVYQEIFNHPELATIDQWEENLVTLVMLFFRHMLHVNGSNLDENIQNVACNAVHFAIFAIEHFFETWPDYKVNLQDLILHLVQELVDFICMDTFGKYQFVNQEIRLLLCAILNGYRDVISTLEPGDVQVVEVRAQIQTIEQIFHDPIIKQLEIFTKNNVFGNLFVITEAQWFKYKANLARKAVIYDLFLGPTNAVQTLQTLDQEDNFQKTIEHKLTSLQHTVHLAHFYTSVLDILLENVYLNSTYTKHDLFAPALQPNGILATIRSLIYVWHHLDGFVQFIFDEDFTSISTGYEQLLQIFRICRKSIENVMQTITQSNSKHWSSLDLISFFIRSDEESNELNGVWYTNTVLSQFFPMLSWMDVINHIGLPAVNQSTTSQQLNKLLSLNFISLLHTDNYARIEQVLTQVMRPFERAVNASGHNSTSNEHGTGTGADDDDAQTTETGSVDYKSSVDFDWSSVSTDQLNQLLLVADCVLYRLTKNKWSLNEVHNLKERLHTLFNLLSWTKFERMFTQTIPQFDDAQYATFLLAIQLLNDAICIDMIGNEHTLLCESNTSKYDDISCVKDSHPWPFNGPVHFDMLLHVLHKWIQILYTSLPESNETQQRTKSQERSHKANIMIIASRILDTFNKLAEIAKKLSPDEDSHQEMIELWRNFLAFHSFNMLLPLFVLLDKSPRRNQVERRFLKRLSKAVVYIDSECLQDITALELNQYLLMAPEDKNRLQHLETTLNQFIKSQHQHHPQRSRHAVTENNETVTAKMAPVNTTVCALSPTNLYYEYLLNHVTPMLLNPHQDWALSSVKLMSIVFQNVQWKQLAVSGSKATENSLKIKQNEIQIAPPESLSRLLILFDEAMKMILLDCEFAEPVHIEPKTEVYQYTFAYLLTWLHYLQMLDTMRRCNAHEAHADLIDYLKERYLHARLFDNLFHLMVNVEELVEKNEFDNPQWMMMCDCSGNLMEEESNSIHNTIDISGDLISNFFVQLRDYPIDLHHFIGNEQSVASLAKLTMLVYYQVLRTLPNLLRSWCRTLKPQQEHLVKNFTRTHFTNLLIGKEIDVVCSFDREKFGNIIVRTSKKTNEINAVYSRGEISFGIRFTFPEDYPLSSVEIECSNPSGVSEDRYRLWIHRLKVFFNKQNCFVLDGLIQLRPNMDKFFEGIEECMICLFVLYGATSDLPRFKCPQCRKKFHFACIRKWFSTNDSSVCPQCKYEFL